MEIGKMHEKVLEAKEIKPPLQADIISDSMTRGQIQIP
jgi:hypothetical protein